MVFTRSKYRWLTFLKITPLTPLLVVWKDNILQYKASTVITRWWKKIQNTHVCNTEDPITLEPVTSLKTESGGEWFFVITENCKTLKFNADALYEYMCSQSTCIEPYQRKELNIIELKRLNTLISREVKCIYKIDAFELCSEKIKERRKLEKEKKELLFFMEDDVMSALGFLRDLHLSECSHLIHQNVNSNGTSLEFVVSTFSRDGESTIISTVASAPPATPPAVSPAAPSAPPPAAPPAALPVTPPATPPMSSHVAVTTENYPELTRSITNLKRRLECMTALEDFTKSLLHMETIDANDTVEFIDTRIFPTRELIFTNMIAWDVNLANDVYQSIGKLCIVIKARNEVIYWESLNQLDSSIDQDGHVGVVGIPPFNCFERVDDESGDDEFIPYESM